jgi:hypothetical protein
VIKSREQGTGNREQSLAWSDSIEAFYFARIVGNISLGAIQVATPKTFP